MYGSATETGELKSPALQAGGPSSSPSGLNGPGAKYIETHMVNGGVASILSAGKSAICCSTGGPRNFLQTTQRLSSLATV